MGAQAQSANWRASESHPLSDPPACASNTSRLVRSVESFNYMHRLLFFLWIAVALNAQDSHSIAQDHNVQQALTVIDTWLENKVKDRRLPSLAISVVHDQQIVFEKVYGNAQVDSLYPFGSGYRTFDAIARFS